MLNIFYFSSIILCKSVDVLIPSTINLHSKFQFKFYKKIISNVYRGLSNPKSNLTYVLLPISKKVYIKMNIVNTQLTIIWAYYYNIYKKILDNYIGYFALSLRAHVSAVRVVVEYYTQDIFWKCLRKKGGTVKV